MFNWNKRKCPTCNKKLKSKRFGYCSEECKDTMIKEIKKAGYNIEKDEVGNVVIKETRNTNKSIHDETQNLY
jgi:endogenous inhibitor of DNA gyrase (YacG/DUF329 family)